MVSWRTSPFYIAQKFMKRLRFVTYRSTKIINQISMYEWRAYINATLLSHESTGMLIFGINSFCSTDLIRICDLAVSMNSPLLDKGASYMIKSALVSKKNMLQNDCNRSLFLKIWS